MGNSQSLAPTGAQLNELHAGIAGSDSFSLTFDTVITSTLPLAAGTGQLVALSDFTAKIRIPDTLAVTAPRLYNSSYYAVNATITFDTINATPSTYSISQTNTFKNWTDSHVNFPVPGTVRGFVLPPLQQLTLGSPGHTDIRLYSIVLSLEYFRPDGSLVGPAVPVVCNREPLSILASVAVDSSGPSGSLITAGINYPASFPLTLPGWKTVIAGIPVIATEPPDYYFALEITSTGPLAVTQGGNVTFTNVKVKVTVPGSIVANLTSEYGTGGLCGVFLSAQAIRGYPGVRVDLTSGTQLVTDWSQGYTASDQSTPAVLNTGRFVECGSQDAIVFDIPNEGYLNITESVDSAGGTIFSLDVQSIRGYIEGVNGQYGSSGKIEYFLSTQGANVLLAVPVQPAPVIVTDS